MKGKQWRVPTGFEGAFVELQSIPYVGKATAEDLVRLGVRGIKDLAGRDAMGMYEQISTLDGVRHDPCVIDVFMAAVEYAKTGSCQAWWKYTPLRKAMLASAAGTPPGRLGIKGAAQRSRR